LEYSDEDVLSASQFDRQLDRLVQTVIPFHRDMAKVLQIVVTLGHYPAGTAFVRDNSWSSWRIEDTKSRGIYLVKKPEAVR